MQANKEILKQLSEKLFNGNEVSEILGNPEIYPHELVEELSVLTAKLFHSREMDYIDGD